MLALLIGFGILLYSLGLGAVFPLVSFALSFLVALESGAIQSWELEIKGFRLAGVISGDDRDVIERRFFEDALAESANPLPVYSGVHADAIPPRAASGLPIIGLFPNPSRPGGSRS